MAVNKMNRKVNLKSKTNRSVLKSKKTKKVSKTMNGGSKCGSNILKGGSKCGSNILKGGGKCSSNILKGGGKSVKRRVSKKKNKQSGVRTLKKRVKKMKSKRQNRTQKKGIKNKKYRTLKKKIQIGGDDDPNLQKIGCFDGIELLLKNEGDFLIRKASEGPELLVKTKTSIPEQYKIENIGDKKKKLFQLVGSRFDFNNLSSLIEHYKKKGIGTISGSYAQQENIKLIHEIVELSDKLAKKTLENRKNRKKGDYVYLTQGDKGGTLHFVNEKRGVHTLKIKFGKSGFYIKKKDSGSYEENQSLKDLIGKIKQIKNLNNQIRFFRDEFGLIQILEETTGQHSDPSTSEILGTHSSASGPASAGSSAKKDPVYDDPELLNLTKVSRETAKQILEDKKIGDFILRTTSSSAVAALSVKVSDTEIRNFPIHQNNNKDRFYVEGLNTLFVTFHNLIVHFHDEKPIFNNVKLVQQYDENGEIISVRSGDYSSETDDNAQYVSLKDMPEQTTGKLKEKRYASITELMPKTDAAIPVKPSGNTGTFIQGETAQQFQIEDPEHARTS